MYETLTWGGGQGHTGANPSPLQSHAVARLSHLHDGGPHPYPAILEPTLLSTHTHTIQEHAKDDIDTLASSWSIQNSCINPVKEDTDTRFITLGFFLLFQTSLSSSWVLLQSYFEYEFEFAEIFKFNYMTPPWYDGPINCFQNKS